MSIEANIFGNPEILIKNMDCDSDLEVLVYWNDGMGIADDSDRVSPLVSKALFFDNVLSGSTDTSKVQLEFDEGTNTLLNHSVLRDPIVYDNARELFSGLFPDITVEELLETVRNSDPNYRFESGDISETKVCHFEKTIFDLDGPKFEENVIIRDDLEFIHNNIKLEDYTKPLEEAPHFYLPGGRLQIPR